MDRYDCYELCVQSPRHVTGFLRAVHGADPRVLREDFCGTAAISRRWVMEGRKAGLDCRAVGVDLDAEVLARAEREVAEADMSAWLRLERLDAVRATVEARDACDVVFVGNFSIGYIHERGLLVKYLENSRRRLEMGGGGWGGGIFVCDIYGAGAKGAANAWTESGFTRKHPSRGRELVHYSWEHRDADPITGMVTNAIHFRVELDGEVIAEMRDAFEYRWRLWSVPELREALVEAGFNSTEVHQEIDGTPRALGHGREVNASGIVCVVGRGEG